MYASLDGDLARQKLLSRSSMQLNQDISRLTREMSSGQRHDPVMAVGGDAAVLALVDHMIARSDAAINRGKHLQARLQTQGDVLKAASDQVQNLADIVMRSELFATDDRLGPIAGQVTQVFESVLGLLNTQVAGRSLFSGTAVDRPALASPKIILDAISTLIPPDAGFNEVNAIVDDWFAQGGGFDTIGYLGTPTEQHGMAIIDGYRIHLAQNAAEPEIRSLLASLAKGALMQADNNFSEGTKRQVLMGIAPGLRASVKEVDGMTELIGIAQARVDQALVQATSRKTVAELTRNELQSADPYATATNLQDRIARLDQLLAITARLSRLSLSNYL